MASKLFVGNLPDGCSADSVRSLFEPYGELADKVSVIKNFAFVHFVNERDATNAVHDLHKSKMFGREINVEVSRKTNRKNNSNDNRARSARNGENRPPIHPIDNGGSAEGILGAAPIAPAADPYGPLGGIFTAVQTLAEFEEERNLDDRNKSFDDRNKSFDDRNKSFDDRNKSFDDRNRSWDDRNRSFDDRNRSFDDRNRSFDDGSRSFGDGNRSFDNRKRSNDDRDRSFSDRNRSLNEQPNRSQRPDMPKQGSKNLVGTNTLDLSDGFVIHERFYVDKNHPLLAGLPIPKLPSITDSYVTTRSPARSQSSYLPSPRTDQSSSLPRSGDNYRERSLPGGERTGRFSSNDYNDNRR